MAARDIEPSVTLTLPKSAVPDVMALSQSLLDRMHHLLERNTDDALTPLEREELETLVSLAQFSQIVAMSLNPSGRDAA